MWIVDVGVVEFGLVVFYGDWCVVGVILIEDVVFEVIDFFEIFVEYVVGGFFVVDIISVEYCYLFVFVWVEVGFDVFGEFVERFGFGVDGVFEGIDGYFIVVVKF